MKLMLLDQGGVLYLPPFGYYYPLQSMNCVLMRIQLTTSFGEIFRLLIWDIQIKIDIIV